MSGVSSSGTFKDFEKKTFDAWEIDDDLSNTSGGGGSIMNTYSLSGFGNNEYAMPISLLVRFVFFFNYKNIFDWKKALCESEMTEFLLFL